MVKGLKNQQQKNQGTGADTGFILLQHGFKIFSRNPISQRISRFFQICFQVYSEMKLTNNKVQERIQNFSKYVKNFGSNIEFWWVVAFL